MELFQYCSKPLGHQREPDSQSLSVGWIPTETVTTFHVSIKPTHPPTHTYTVFMLIYRTQAKKIITILILARFSGT